MSESMPTFDPSRSSEKTEERWACLSVLSHSQSAAWTIHVDRLVASGSGSDLPAPAGDPRSWVSDQMWASALADMLERALDAARQQDALAPKTVGSKCIGLFRWEGVSVAMHGLYVDCSPEDWPKWRDWIASGLSSHLGSAVAPLRDGAASSAASWKEMAEDCVGAAKAAYEARTIEACARTQERMGLGKSAKGGRI